MSTESSLSASVISDGLCVFAISTLTPFCSIGVTTMKMISRTSMTSAIGVTLISAVTSPRPPPPPIPIVLPLVALLFDEVIDQLRRGIRHLDRKGFDLVREDVVRPHRGNCHEESECRRNEGFRNTAGDSRQTGSLGCGHFLECVDDTDRGSEEADEGSGCTDGRKTRKAALQLGVDDGFSAFAGAPGRFYLLACQFIGHAVRPELLESSLHNLRQVAALVLLGDADGFFNLSLFQTAGDCRREFTRLLSG